MGQRWDGARRKAWDSPLAKDSLFNRRILPKFLGLVSLLLEPLSGPRVRLRECVPCEEASPGPFHGAPSQEGRQLGAALD